jgi:hypothetical protein
MAKRKTNSASRSKATEARRLRAIYKESRARFGADDLQKFTEVEEGVAIEKVLAGLEASHRKLSRKRS